MWISRQALRTSRFFMWISRHDLRAPKIFMWISRQALRTLRFFMWISSQIVDIYGKKNEKKRIYRFFSPVPSFTLVY